MPTSWPYWAALFYNPLSALPHSGQVCTHFCKMNECFAADLSNFPKGCGGCLSWKYPQNNMEWCSSQNNFLPHFPGHSFGKCCEISMLDGSGDASTLHLQDLTRTSRRGTAKSLSLANNTWWFVSWPWRMLVRSKESKGAGQRLPWDNAGFKHWCRWIPRTSSLSRKGCTRSKLWNTRRKQMLQCCWGMMRAVCFKSHFTLPLRDIPSPRRRMVFFI